MDEIYEPEKQTESAEYFYYSENNLPFPLPDLNNRLKGKYLKAQTHTFLNHDIFIWVDGSVEIINEKFIETCIEQLKRKDIITSLHTQRKNVYEEISYIINKMRGGDKYLMKRYARQPLFAEYEFYKNEGLPKNYPLYQCSFFARWNNERVNNIFDDWWQYILRYSNFDQSQFSYVGWKHGAKIKAIETDGVIKRHKHC